MLLDIRERGPSIDAIEPGHNATVVAPSPEEVFVTRARAWWRVTRYVVIPWHSDDLICREAKRTEVFGEQVQDEFVPAGFATALCVAGKENAIERARFSVQTLDQAPEQ